MNYQKFPESEYNEILNDEELIETSLKNSSDYNINMLTQQLVKYQSKLLTSSKHRNIVQVILSRNGNLLQYFPNYQNDRELVKIALENNVQSFEFASCELRSDIELCGMVLSKNGSLMRYVTNEQVKNDKRIALISIENSETTFRYLSENLKSDLDFCKIALKRNYRIFPYLPYELRNDISIFKYQPRVESLPFEYFGEDVKKNIEFQMYMIRKNPRNMNYASNEIKLDREFIREFATTNYIAFNYVYDEYSNDREMSLWFCKCSAANYTCINPLFKQDDQFNIELIQYIKSGKYFGNIEYLDRKYFENDIELLKMFSDGLKYASETLKNNKEIVKYFIEKRGFNFSHASITLKNDIDIVKLAINGGYFSALEETSLKLERNFILEMIEKNEGIPMSYFPSSSELRKDPQVVLNTAKYRISNIDGADVELLNNFQFINQIVEQTNDKYGCIYNYVGRELKSNWEFIKYCVERNTNTLYNINKNYVVDYIELLEICIKKGHELNGPLMYSCDNGIAFDERAFDFIEKYPQYSFTLYKRLKYSEQNLAKKVNLVKYFTLIQEKYGNELKNSNEFKEFCVAEEWKQDKENSY